MTSLSPPQSSKLEATKVEVGPGISKRSELSSGVIDGKKGLDDWTIAPQGDQASCDENNEDDYVTVDLGYTATLDAVVLYHYWVDGRQYCGQKVEISSDGNQWTTVYDTGSSYGPVETKDGNRVEFSPTPGRYIRHTCGRSNKIMYAHFLEIETYGVDVSTLFGHTSDTGLN